MNGNYTLITGASSGMGQALAYSLSSSRSLILSGLPPEGLDQTKKNCANPDNHISWNCDFLKLDDVAPSLSLLMTGHNAFVDCYVHCAGIVKVLPIKAFDPIQVREIFNVNFNSAVEIVRILTNKKYNNRQLKNIVFISSIWGKYGEKGYTMYCASKAALDGLMKALAIELAPDIRVNCILPGGVRTPMSENIYQNPELLEKVKADYPLGLGEVRDIVNAIEFLISDKARWITGQQFIVDGGKTAH